MNTGIWLFIAAFIVWVIGKYIPDVPGFCTKFIEAKKQHAFWKSIKIAFIQVRL